MCVDIARENCSCSAQYMHNAIPTAPGFTNAINRPSTVAFTNMSLLRRLVPLHHRKRKLGTLEKLLLTILSSPFTRTPFLVCPHLRSVSCTLCFHSEASRAYESCIPNWAICKGSNCDFPLEEKTSPRALMTKILSCTTRFVYFSIRRSRSWRQQDLCTYDASLPYTA